MANAQTKTWFITGAARGLGFEIASAAAAAGDNVVVTGRNLEKLQTAYSSHGSNVLTLELDVCNDKQINTCVKQAIEHFGRIDVLVNNAGYGQLGIFEEIARQKIESQFNTNVFGLMAVTRAVLPYMREQRAGQIFNISSIAGTAGYDGASVYCATKFAVEGFSESLALEVKQFGISDIIVEPGFFRTDFLDDSSVSYGDIQLDDYKEYSAAVNDSYQSHNHQQAGDPVKFGQAILTLANEDNPPLHFAAGSDAVENIRTAYNAHLKDLNDWAHLSTTTDIE
ncbi:oxidoreductase [Aliidiomarina maris]|uniref:Short-chain dehydrogenase/reductase n=1 Tax=Aliidiomarina maris TaxID=531312 RepID=A0A327WNI7_9GAMM|nr:oxidoreductase [Aliidiomarina maris]RAJ93599.1 short-subunit dehydrogenase [Aliidiomarina maris]RUO19054.1 short-chain dehydrogenase/reductase [Aliidiomarina maris]